MGRRRGVAVNVVVPTEADLANVAGRLTSAAAALEIDAVSHAYGNRKVLDDVSFRAEPGQFTALLGLNGAGKTTLLSLITRLFDTKTGIISVLGHRIDREPGEALRRMGVVFQARTLDLDLSVMDNLLFHAALHGIASREARKRAEAALVDVEMPERARDKARLLSGGQMRRVEIARALMHGPSLLVLDEPTVGLDVASRLAIMRHVRRLVTKRGVAVLWTTHLLDEIEPTDRLIILHHGKVVAAGVVSDVLGTSLDAGGDGSLREAFASLTGGGERSRDVG